jgi:hypothetical protein
MKELILISKRCYEASPMPWSIHRYSVDDYNSNHICGDFVHNEDKVFIANARQDVPAVLAEVGRLQAEITKLKKQLNEAKAWISFAEEADRERNRAEQTEGF